MPVMLMQNAKILLDLTLVPAKTVSQEMEKHALVRFTYQTGLFLPFQMFFCFQEHP